MNVLQEFIEKDPITGMSVRKTKLALNSSLALRNAYDVVESYNESKISDAQLSRENLATREILKGALKNVKVNPLTNSVSYKRKPFFSQVKRLRLLIEDLSKEPMLEITQERIKKLEYILNETLGKTISFSN